MKLNYKRKFRNLFDKFCKGDFELSAYHHDQLLKFLETSTDQSAVKVLETPYFSDLILHSLRNFENIRTSVKVFIVEVLRIMLRNELQFCKVMQTDGPEWSVLKVLSSNAVIASAALRTSRLKLSFEILEHSSGIMWSIKKNMFQIVFRSNIHKISLSRSKVAYGYIAKLVWKLDEYGEEAALLDVLSDIVGPIRYSKYITIKELTDETDEALFDEIVSNMRALLAILSDTERLVRKNKVFPLLLSYFLIETSLRLMIQTTRHPELCCLINDIGLHMVFANIVHHAQVSNSYTFNDVPHDISVSFYNMVMNAMTQKRMVYVMLQTSASYFKFWSKVDGFVPSTFERNGTTFDVRDQFLVMLIIILMHHWDEQCRNDEPYSDKYNFKSKITQLATCYTIKAVYATRFVIDDKNLNKYSIGALKELFKLIDCLNDKQAGFIYQALFYNLSRYVKSDEQPTSSTAGESNIKSPDDIKIISFIVEMIKRLLTRYNVNWYESLEIVSLQNCLMNLLMQNELPNKQLLQVLDLIGLSIKKQLSPDLALLVESRRGSTLNAIVAMMKTFIQHSEWEVRDSALHLLLSCTDLAHIKYIPFQKLLFENELLVLAAHAAIFDEEMYVQATALRCLAAATRIESIWRHVTTAHPNLCMQIINILCKHPEGIVRKEATNILTELYVNQKNTPDFTKYLCDVMTLAAIDDLHWEVQISALKFWKTTVQYTTTKWGMIDGKFPTTTFCKVRRKIIVLNDQVIRERLIEIFNDLASNGCLKVLVKCLGEDISITVIEEAYAIAKDLISILNVYIFEKLPQDETHATRNVESVEINEVNMDSYLTFEMPLPESLREQVRQSIVNTNQCDLILQMYENSVDVKRDILEEEVFIPTVDKWMDPNNFVQVLRSNNFPKMIENKKNWNSGPKSLDDLLNEILSMEKNDEISAECE